MDGLKVMIGQVSIDKARECLCPEGGCARGVEHLGKAGYAGCELLLHGSVVGCMTTTSAKMERGLPRYHHHDRFLA